MALNTALLTCAAEFLLSIFKLLDNIDDALHLARSLRQLNTVFKRYRRNILRTIIVSVKHNGYPLLNSLPIQSTELKSSLVLHMSQQSVRDPWVRCN